MYYQEGYAAYVNNQHICPYGDWLNVYEAREWHAGWNRAYDDEMYAMEMEARYA